MLSPGPATKIYLAAGSTDMRKSFNGLYTLVAGTLALDPASGHLFVFCNRRRDRIKILCFDGSGLWVCAKRLEKGTFYWPGGTVDGPVELSQAQLNLLLGGLDLRQTKERRWIR
jgi:transposase